MIQFLSKLKAYLTSPAFNTARAIIYAALTAGLGVLVTTGKLSQNNADLWGAVAVAFVGPALASVFAPSGWKTWVYGLVAPIQALLIGLGGANNVTIMMVAALLGSIVTAGIAASNVHRAAPSASAP